MEAFFKIITLKIILDAYCAELENPNKSRIKFKSSTTSFPSNNNHHVYFNAFLSGLSFMYLGSNCTYIFTYNFEF